MSRFKSTTNNQLSEVSEVSEVLGYIFFFLFIMWFMIYGIRLFCELIVYFGS